MPLVLTIDLKKPDPGMVTRAAAVLRAGGLVAFPTETVYGLGANATSRAAVRRLFEAKGRPRANPVIVHVLEPADLREVSSRVPPMARRLAEAFWPGPLTVVVPRGGRIVRAVSGRRPTVAVRAPAHPVARALLSAAALPIAAPSANSFGRASPTTATHVLTDLGDKVDIVIDGGPCDIGIESTVVDCTSRPAHVLRPGGVTIEALREVAPSIRLAPPTDRASPRSSGRMKRHYAPQARLILLTGEHQDLRAVVARVARNFSADGRHVGVMSAREDLPWLGNLGRNVRVVALAALDDPAAAAHDLFATLRSLDAMGVDVILARDFGHDGLALAIHDRLLRAAGGHLVEIAPREVDAAVEEVRSLAS